ncbi:phage virion morphogenesis protein [Paracoccus sp. (in: a-proteobacteria)]|uniref:phage virion morphogenesis protein n=1 Tax=Paracoccus sp. TaxID=267 RepID=UPI002AFFF2DC|nr:phage virion morphogenesis protein [Paracoccus sp. (in: a-proteobacteria)]
MVGVAVETDIGIAARALDRLTTEQLELIAYEAGTLIEDQTRLRIADDKTAPDGSDWVPWSESYAETRKPRHSLLMGEGNPGLLESIQNYTTGMNAVVGTNLIHGAIHQFGSEDGTLPARSYLGLSADNRAAIEDLVVGRLEDLLQ